MKKILLLFFLPAIILLQAQNSRLAADLERDKVQRNAKFQTYHAEASPEYAQYLEERRPVLAGFIDNTPIFWQVDDKRANIAHNVIPLQEGTLPRLNGVKLDGTGLRILVMDGGRVFEAHQEFTNTGNTRVTDRENGSVNYNSHATNVAGIIGAAGVRNFSDALGGTGGARGVLPNVFIDSYAFATTPLGDNYQKLQNAPAANVSNHSYGINVGWSYNASGPLGAGWYYPFQNYSTEPKDTFAGSYYDQDASFDRIVYANQNQIVVKSAGNYYGDGPKPGDPVFVLSEDGKTYRALRADELAPATNCGSGYNCIGWGSLAKNIIVVGAADQLPPPFTNTNYDNVIRSNYSSVGPRKDGAVKPDISAVGTNMVIATYTSATVFDSYGTGQGTSFSAPVISGIAGALTQLYQKISGNTTAIYKADEMKALLIHSAVEAGRPGPDIDFGWGFADASKAAEIVLDKTENKNIFERKTLTSGSAFTQNVTAANTPLKVSISWVDPAATPFRDVNKLFYDTSSRLVNDLDLRITDTETGEVYFPWKLSIADPLANAVKGDNTVDNVEQVLITNPVAGRIYKIDVTHKGTLVNETGTTAEQHFTIIATGIGAAVNQDPNAPTVKTKNITVNLDQNGQATITAKDVDNGSSDLQTPQSELVYSLSKTTFTCAELGANTVTLTVTDADGKSSSATATVTVVDNLAPQFEVNPSVTVDMAGKPLTLQSSQVLTSLKDNCDSAPAVTFSTATFTKTGTYNVVVTVKDKSGNTSTKNITVIVKDSFANISNLFDITVQNETCDGKANGKITVQASRDLAYSYKLNDGPYTAFRNTVSIENLKAGIYRLCIKLENETEYCYELNIGKPVNLIGKVAVSADGKTAHIRIEQGTGPFVVSYGNRKTIVEKPGSVELSLDGSSNSITIHSAIQCEGEVTQSVFSGLLDQLTLYPNPVTDILKIRYFASKDVPVVVRIYDMSQKMLLEKNFPARTTEMEFNLASWNAGMYLVIIQAGEKTETKKIIKK